MIFFELNIYTQFVLMYFLKKKKRKKIPESEIDASLRNTMFYYVNLCSSWHVIAKAQANVEVL